MKFDDPEVIESICYQMRMADYTRGQNRVLINNLFNGYPPYTQAEADDNGNEDFNVNFLEGTRLSHDARAQFYQSVMKPGAYFTSTTDWGPVHKRQKAGAIVTKERAKIMKKSMVYTESMRSKIAMNVLHGIAPCGWRDEQMWRPYAMGIEDVYVPGSTLLTMENLPFFAIYRTMSAPEMIKLATAGNVDPAWNVPMLNAAIRWVDKEAQTLMYNNWPEVWAPEKTAERVKGDGGFYFGDQVPTINVFDFYFWNDSGNEAGWNRRMILDAWSMPEESQVGAQKTPNMVRRKGKLYDNYRRRFLYNPGKRKIARDRSEIVNWQFADLSAVAPFRYHSVRSLGYLLYSICHLQNRMRCRFSEAVFEQLMIYFRINTEQDMQRSLKVDLTNRGFIDDSVTFIPPNERYQVNPQLAQLGLMMNQQLISANASSFTSAGSQNMSGGNRERTKFEVMAEVNAMQTLVSSALSQAYMYQNFEYEEIARRFAIKGSRDPEVRSFQAACIRQGVSEKLIYNPECWSHEANRVIGAGNKTLELAIAEQLMTVRNLYDPESQRQILREYTTALTDDAAKADSWVPESPNRITDSVHDAQLTAGTLMQGLPVALKKGMNHIEYVDTLMATLMQLIQMTQQSGQMPTPERVSGMFNLLNHIAQHIQIIAQDQNEKQRVKQYGDQLGKLGNMLKGIAQQVAEQQQAGNGEGGQNAELAAKIQAMQLQAQVKAENTKTAHAQRTAQRQIAFELEQQRKNEALAADLRRSQVEAAQDFRLNDMTTANDIVLERAKAKNAPKKVDRGGSSD